MRLRVRSIRWKTEDSRDKMRAGERITILGGIVVFITSEYWMIRWKS